MCKQPTPWEKCVDFHGHICPGLMIGFKAATLAMEELGISKSRDEEIIVLTENKSCAVDAIQVLTGCTFGKGNLFYNAKGKHVFTLANRRTGEAVRVAVKPNLVPIDPQYKELKDKVRTSEITDEENNLFIEKQLAACQQILDMSVELPPKAEISGTVVCHKCGEGVMEPCAKTFNGHWYCPDCI